MRGHLRFVVALVVLLLAFGGCDRGPSTEHVESNPVDSGAESDPGKEGGACEPGDPTDPALTVTLDEYEILPEEDKLTRGPTRFRAVNAGKDTHELYVILARSIEALPLDPKGAIDIEALEEEDRVLGELHGIRSGRSCDLELDLDPETYVMICNIRERSDEGVVNHFLQGMRARIKVE